MIESLLIVTEESFNLSNDDTPEEVWAEKVKVITPHFMEIFNNIMLPPIQAFISPTPFPHSTHEVFWNKQSSIKIVTSRFRPTNEYYQNSGDEILQPENPNGCHAAGVSLEAHLFAAFTSNKYSQNASITVDFEVWGREERTKFIEFYNDHRKVIKSIFELSNFSFSTSCVFESLESYRGKDLGKILDLYLQEEDPESIFTISYDHFSKNDTYELVKAYFILSVVYDSFFQYLIKRGDKEKILKYYGMLKK